MRQLQPFPHRSIFTVIRYRRMRELHLFAGAGGGILGGMLLGHTCVCAVEIEPYRRSVLLARQRDGSLPKFPIWDDVRTFDGRPWRGLADAVCGGFPCQDISGANSKAEGISGKRSGLWSEMRRVVGEVRPRYVLVENSPILTSRGLGTVLGDLAELGFNARWGVVSAADTGAPHLRRRIWIFADSKLLNVSLTGPTGGDSGRPRQAESRRKQDHSPDSRLRGGIRLHSDADKEHEEMGDHRPAEERSEAGDGSPGLLGDGEFWREVEQPEPIICRVGNGMANRVDRLAATGDGQVPAVVRLAWDILT